MLIRLNLLVNCHLLRNASFGYFFFLFFCFFILWCVVLMYGVSLQTQTDLVEKREETFRSVFAV